MTDLHRKLRRTLYETVPADWSKQKECRGNRFDDEAIWRADVIAQKDDCVVALEAQCGGLDGFHSRCDAYLKTGVWPLWFFTRIPGAFREEPVFTVGAIANIPAILNELYALPMLETSTWEEERAYLKQLTDHFKATPENEDHYRGVLKMNKKSGFKVGYAKGFAAGWKDAKAKFEKERSS